MAIMQNFLNANIKSCKVLKKCFVLFVKLHIQLANMREAGQIRGLNLVPNIKISNRLNVSLLPIYTIQSYLIYSTFD